MDVWVLVELREMGALATGGNLTEAAFDPQVLGVFRALPLAQAAVCARVPAAAQAKWDTPEEMGATVPTWALVLAHGTQYEITQMPVQDA